MKKLINKPDNFINEVLKGMAKAHPDILDISLEPKYIFRADAGKKAKVAVISGGGSGHEPLHGGYVGHGMLDAACPGEVFTSPTPDQMYEAAKKVETGNGVLFIVKNYTGDVMNFEMAADMARADGIDVRNIIIDDDVAIKDSLWTAGRRGVGVTVLAEKICGAAAEAGEDLETVTNLCRKVNLNGRSMGVALSACTTPGNDEPGFELADDKVEIGIGIHGEPGVEQEKMSTADDITERLVTTILEDKNYTRNLHEWDTEKEDWVDKEFVDEPLNEGDSVIVMVNGMGGTPVSELYVVYRKVVEMLESKNIKVARSLVGDYITSLEMQGTSVTLLKADDELIKWYDKPVRTAGLTW